MSGSNDAPLRADADSLDGVSLASVIGVSATDPALDTRLDADLDSVTSDSDLTPRSVCSFVIG